MGVNTNGPRPSRTGKKVKGRPGQVDFQCEILYHTPLNKEKKMAIHNSALRQHRRSIRRTAVNKKNKSGLRTEVRKVRELIADNKKDEALKSLAGLQSVVDKNVKKRAIPKNKANRLKSRLSRQAARVTAADSK
jgi:small subunit ribosomal protein S20